MMKNSSLTSVPAQAAIAPQPGMASTPLPTAISPPLLTTLRQKVIGLNTPQCLQLSLGVICASSLWAMVSVLAATNAQREAFKILQKDTTPSILNAQRIKDNLADLDAIAANDLLQGILTPTANKKALALQDEVNGASALKANPNLLGVNLADADHLDDLLLADPATGQPLRDAATNELLAEGFEYRQNQLAGWLTKVSQNITYTEEWQPIWQMQYGLGNYLELVQRAKDLQAQGDREGMLKTYRQAIALMDERLLPAADQLAQVNYDHLQIQYRQQQQTVTRNLGWVLVSGGLLLGSLAWLQFFLSQRTHRLLNLWLLGATAVAAVALAYTAIALISSGSALQAASQDAFNSLYSLHQLRSLSYMANASESRYLLDRSAASFHEVAFQTRTKQIFDLKPGKSFDPARFQEGSKIDPTVAEGLVVKALNNITFVGEWSALKTMLETWNQYLGVDRTLRQLAESGKLNDAIALCVGEKENQSNALFKQFRDANDHALKINADEFFRSIAFGNATVANFPVMAPIAFGSIILLSVLGLRPRFQEYR